MSLEAVNCPRCGTDLGYDQDGDRMVGQLLGPWRLEEVRRRTPTGLAWSAIEESTGRALEVRVLALAGASAAQRARWRREAGRRLTHPALTRVLGTGEAGDFAYVATDVRPDERTLEEVVRDSGPLEVRRALAMARQVARALSHIHELGLVHRGITPTSVLLDVERGSTRVTDLGFVRAGGEGHAEGSITGSHEVLGDPRFVAPESVGGGADRRSDLYSLGATLAFALTGRHDVPASLEGRRHLVVEVAGAAPELRDLIASLTEPDAAHRPPSAGAVEQRLGMLLGDGPATLTPTPTNVATAAVVRRRIELTSMRELAEDAPLDPERLDALPLPLGHALLAAWNARAGLPRRMVALVLWERFVRLLGAVGVGLLREAAAELPAPLAARPFRPSFGVWTQILRESHVGLAEDDDVGRLLSALLDEPIGRKTLVEFIDELVATRNEVAHRWPADRNEATLISTMLELAGRAPFLRRGRLIVIQAAAASSGGMLCYEPLELQGASPRRGPSFEGEPGLETGCVYWRHDGRRFIDLSPFLVWNEGELLLLQKAERADRPRFDTLEDGPARELRELGPRILALAREAGASGNASGEGPVEGGERPQGKSARARAVVPDPGVDMIGRVLGGTFRIVERLGTGGMGTVYRGWDTRLRRGVALKVLRAELLSSEVDRRRFDSEARVLASLVHPRVVRLFEAGRETGLFYYAMELLPGPSLEGWIAEKSADAAQRAALLPDAAAQRRAAMWIRDAARAVQEAHSKGIIHRDLKPANLMLDAEEQVKVLDFGLARIEGEDVTRTRSQLGTPRYMAPEQALDSKRVDALADVYSLGATLYALLSVGKPFHEATSEHDVLRRAQEGHLEPLASRAPGVAEELQTITAKAMAVVSARRYASAGALADDLDRWLDGRPILARPSGVVERIRKYVRREPARAAGLSVLLVTSVVMASLAGLWQRAAQDAHALAAEAESQAKLAQAARRREHQQRLEAELGSFRSEVARFEADQFRPLKERWKAGEARGVVIDAGRVTSAALALAASAPDLREATAPIRSELASLQSRLATLRQGTGTLLAFAAADCCARVLGGRIPSDALAVAPDGSMVLVGAANLLVEYDLRTGRAVRVLEGHAFDVDSCCYSPDGRLIASAAPGEELILWERASGRPLHVLPGSSPGDLPFCAFSPDGRTVLGGGPGGVLRLWDATTGELVRSFSADGNTVNACAFAPDGSVAVAACDDGRVRRWQVGKGQALPPLQGHEGGAWTVCVSPDSKQALSGGADNALRLWDLASGQALQSFEGHTSTVLASGFSPDGAEVLSASADETVRLWDVTGGRPPVVMSGHNHTIQECAFAGDTIVSLDGDGTLRTWDRRGRPRATFADRACGAVGAVPSPDGAEVLTLSDQGELQTFDLVTGELVRVRAAHGLAATGYALSPDGTEVLTASRDRTLRLWDRATGALIRSVAAVHTASVTAVAFGVGAFASGAADGSVILWDRGSLGVRARPEGHRLAITSLAFSPDGVALVTGSRDKTLALWNARTGLRERPPFEGHTGVVRECVFSPDGHELLSVSEDSTARIWDRRTGVQLGQLIGQGDALQAGCYSPDGGRIATASADAKVRVWERGSLALLEERLGLNPPGSLHFLGDDRLVKSGLDGTRVWQLQRPPPRRLATTSHTDSIPSVVADSRGALLASGSVDNSTRAWLRESGLPVGSLLAEDDVLSVALSGDGRWLLAGCSDEALRLVDLHQEHTSPFVLPARGVVESVAWARSAARFLVGTTPGELTLWSALDRSVVRRLQVNARVSAVALAPDGETGAFASADGTLRVWDATGATREIGRLEGTCNRCQFMDDAARLVTADAECELTVWDVASAAKLLVVAEHSETIYDVAVSADGALLASASEDGTVCVWDRATGTKLRSQRLAVLPRSVSFAADDQELLVGDQKGGLWSCRVGRLPGVSASVLEKDPVGGARRLLAKVELFGSARVPPADAFPTLVPVGDFDPLRPEEQERRGLELLLGTKGTSAQATGRLWLRSAAEQRRSAASRLAWAYRRGLGGPRDVEAARRLAAKARSLGDPLSSGDASGAAARGDRLARTQLAVKGHDLPALRALAAESEPEALLALAAAGERPLVNLARAAATGDPDSLLAYADAISAVDTRAGLAAYLRATAAGEEARALPGLARTREGVAATTSDMAEAVASWARVGNQPADEGRCRRRLAAWLLQDKDFVGALREFRTSVELLESCPDPTSARLRAELAVARAGLAVVLDKGGDPRGAAEAWAAARPVLLGLEPTPDVAAQTVTAAVVRLDELCDLLRGRGDLAGALEARESHRRLRRLLADAQPTHASLANAALASMKLGGLLSEAGRHKDGLTAVDDSIARRRTLLVTRVDAPCQRGLLLALTVRARIFARQGDLGSALRDVRDAVEVAEGLGDNETEHFEGLADAHLLLARILLARGELAEVAPALESASQLLQAAAKPLDRLEETRTAADDATRAAELLAAEEAPTTPDDHRALARELHRRGEHGAALEHFGQAELSGLARLDAARCAVLAEDLPRALAWLGQELEAGAALEDWLDVASADPVFEPLRSTPELRALLEQTRPKPVE